MSLSIERLQALSPQRLALLAAELQARLEAAEARHGAPIAIVGIGCRFPGGARDADGFWRFLRDGGDAVEAIPRDRWDVDAYFDPDPYAPGRMSTRWGAFIEGIDRFDAAFFGIAPREAEGMDPQQRLLLEVAWEALERAGQSPEALLNSRTGVFVGISGSDYYQVCKAASGEAGLDAHSASGAAHSVAAGRLSYVLGLQGPNLAVDTACSSSLVAFHLAVQSLRRGECDMALAGGVNAILAPDTSIALSKLRMMAPDGRCKVFDAAADGFVRGEGCGVVVLRRLADALAYRDPVVAVVRGSAVNHDGRSHGLTAPNGPAQAAVLRAALADAGVAPASVDFVETHGTGTALGDPIELQALGDVYGPGRDRPLMVGSVKTNIGHLESAAGIAGLIKAALALACAEIPPHLHLRTPNPFVPWRQLPIAVPTTATPWPPAGHPRRAAVSSFGFSGTNVHVVLEAAPDAIATPGAVATSDGTAGRPRHVFTLSARTESALRALVARHASHPAVDGASLADVCFTAAAGRSHFAHRLALAVRTPDALRDALATIAAGGDPPGLRRGHASPARPPKIAFLFTGQGAQHIGMGRQLYDAEPTFRRALERCDDLLRPHLGRPLTALLYPDPGDPGAAAVLDDTTYTQPALFAVGYALAELWRAWGVTPAWVMGHSVGELAAACAAGLVRLEDGARLIAARARLMGALPCGGAMAAVFADAGQVDDAIAPYAGRLVIAAYNGPDNVVVAGAAAALDDLVADLARRGIQARALNVSHAFHSPLMDPMLDAWTAAAAGLAPGEPTAGLVSNVTGRPATAADLADPNHWRRHARAPVRFAEGMRTLRDEGCDVFIEIGPSPVLLGMGARCVPDASTAWLPSLRRGRDDWAVILDSVAELYVRGATVDWEGFDRDHDRRRCVLPTYPFERERHWVKAAPLRPAPAAPGSADPGPREAVDGHARRNDGSDGRDDSGARPSDRDRVAALLHRVVWRRVSVGGLGGPPVTGDRAGTPATAVAAPAPADLAGRLEARIASLRAENGLDRHDALLPRLDDLAAGYTVAALRTLGWMAAAGDVVTVPALAARLGIVDRHHRLLGRLMAMLAEEGCLEAVDDRWMVRRDLPAVDPEALHRSVAAAFPAGGAELALLGRCGARLADVLRGAVDPLDVLFPGGSLAEAERLYQDAPAARTFNALVADAVAALANAWPADRTLRVLEIGAGTGGTTARVLPVLPPDRTAYTFTDVSSRFTAHAAAKFAAYPFVAFRTLDIAADPAGQGFAPEAYDIVIAANVLHATPDLRRSLAHVRALMAPAGKLVLLEATCPTRFGDLTVGLTAGWWSFVDLDRRPDHALLSRAHWLSLLADAGFEGAVAVPAAAEGVMGQQAVLLAGRGASTTDRFPADGAADLATADGAIHPLAMAGAWLVLADRSGLGARLADRLRSGGARCVVATYGRPFSAVGDDAFEVDPTSAADLSRLVRAVVDPTRPPLAGVVYLSALDAADVDAAVDPDPAAAEPAPVGPAALPVDPDRVTVGPADPSRAAERRTVGGALHLVQALLKGGPLPPPRLWLVTRGARSVDVAGASGPARGAHTRAPSAALQAALWGFGQVVDLEHPELRCGRLDLDPAGLPASDLEALLAVLGGGGGRETALAVRQGDAYAPRLVRWTAASDSTLRLLDPPTFRADATYLVTGGLGGLGLCVAAWLVEHGARHLVLIGRHTGGSRDRADGGGRVRPDIRGALGAMEALGATVEVARADVADRDRLAAVFADVAGRLPPVRGIVHAAGVLADGAILNQSWDRFAAVMAPKVAGTRNLADLARGLPLDFLALFSSGAAVLGSAGQANHAAANAVMDAVAFELRASGVPAVSLNWGAWAEIGAAARTRNTARSVNVIIPADGLAALGAALGGSGAAAGPPLAQVAVLPVEGPHFWARFDPADVPPLLAELVPAIRPGEHGSSAAEDTLDLRTALTGIPPNRRFAVVLGQVRAHAAAVLGLAAERVIDADAPLSELGLDSLMAVELRNRLGRAAGAALPPTLLFEHPTIQALAEHLDRTMAAADRGVPRDGEDGHSEDALAAMLFAKLSDLEKRLEDTAHA